MKNKYLPAVWIIKTGSRFKSFCIAILFRKQPYIAGCNVKEELTSTALPKTLTEKQSLNLRGSVKCLKSLNGEYSLNLLCLTLGIPQATYYRAIESKETQFEIKCKTLTPIIEEIFNESKQSYGARKITEIPREKGFSVSPNTVAKIMHSNGWFSIRAGAKKLYLQNQKRMENLLCQQFSVSKPNEVWVSDVTEIKYGKYRYFICVVLDLFSRKVIAYHTSFVSSFLLLFRYLHSFGYKIMRERINHHRHFPPKNLSPEENYLFSVVWFCFFFLCFFTRTIVVMPPAPKKLHQDKSPHIPTSA